jgi:hypothetical protein
MKKNVKKLRLNREIVKMLALVTGGAVTPTEESDWCTISSERPGDCGTTRCG